MLLPRKKLDEILLSSSNLQQSYVTSNFSSATLQGKKENLTILKAAKVLETLKRFLHYFKTKFCPLLINRVVKKALN